MMTNRERYKRAFSAVHASDHISLEVRTMKRTKKWNIKTCAAIAACAALVMALGLGGILLGRDGVSPGAGSANGADGSAAGGGDRAFTLTAYAAELEPEREVPVVIDNSQGWVLTGDEGGDGVSYCIGTLFRCEGEDIDHITYSINRGAFQIVEQPQKSIILDAKDAGEKLNPGILGGTDEGERTEPDRVRYVTEYTLAYGAQKNDTTWISVCGSREGAGLFSAIWPKDGTDRPQPDVEAGIYTQLLDGVEITCTVYFADGTSASRVITGAGKVMTPEETGIDGSGEDAAVSPDTKRAFFVFGLK